LFATADGEGFTIIDITDSFIKYFLGFNIFEMEFSRFLIRLFLP
jgi:hypothetical protein